MPDLRKTSTIAGAALAFLMLFGLLPGSTGFALAAPPEALELPGLREAPEIPVGSIILRRALPGHPLPQAARPEIPGRGAPVQEGLAPPGSGCDKDIDLTGTIAGVEAVAAQDNGICTSADIDTYVSGAGRTYVVQAGGQEAAWIHTDVTDPANPTVVGSYSWRGGRGKNTYTPDLKTFHKGDGQNQRDYIVMGLERMAAVAFCGVVIYDVTDPGNAVLQSQFIGNDWCDVHNVFVEGDFVYATADNTQDLRVLDISNPADPIELGTYRRQSRGFGDTVYDDIYVHDVTVHNGTVYASYWLAGLDIFPAYLINIGSAVIDETNLLVTTIEPGEIATGTPFLVHHAVPSWDGNFAFLEDEITFSAGAEPVQMWDVDDVNNPGSPLYVDGLALGTDVPVNPAHNLEINYDIDPDRLYVAWYKLGLQGWDFDGDGFKRNFDMPHTADVFHQAQTEASDDAYSGAWGVRLAEIGTFLYIFQSDRNFGLIVDCEVCPTPTTGTVIGTVTDSGTGSPIAGASVAADTGQSTTTGIDGTYTLSNVPTGTRTVIASATGYVTQPDTTTVTDGGTSTLDFALAPEPVGGGTGTIKGTVTDATTGAKLSGVLVTTDTGEDATTNKRGKYSIRKVPAGSYTVTASGTGYVTQQQPAMVTADQTSPVDFALVPQ